MRGSISERTPRCRPNCSTTATICRHGVPGLSSASNKGFLGELVGTEVDDRREATFGAHALGIALGCRILRRTIAGYRRLADTMSAVLQGAATTATHAQVG